MENAGHHENHQFDQNQQNLDFGQNDQNNHQNMEEQFYQPVNMDTTIHNGQINTDNGHSSLFDVLWHILKRIFSIRPTNFNAFKSNFCRNLNLILPILYMNKLMPDRWRYQQIVWCPRVLKPKHQFINRP